MNFACLNPTFWSLIAFLYLGGKFFLESVTCVAHVCLSVFSVPSCFQLSTSCFSLTLAWHLVFLLVFSFWLPFCLSDLLLLLLFRTLIATGDTFRTFFFRFYVRWQRACSTFLGRSLFLSFLFLIRLHISFFSFLLFCFFLLFFFSLWFFLDSVLFRSPFPLLSQRACPFGTIPSTFFVTLFFFFFGPLWPFSFYFLF